MVVMKNSHYAFLFLLLSFLFIPVCFSYVTVWVVASCFLQLMFLRSIHEWNLAGLIFDAFGVVEMAVYCMLFIGLLKMSLLLTAKVSERRKACIQLIVLLMIVSSSFVRVVQGNGLVESTAGLNFWDVMKYRLGW